jgi:hypothetical protein
LPDVMRCLPSSCWFALQRQARVGCGGRST